jgi:hypothetical protein
MLRLREVASEVIRRKDGSGFSALLGTILDLSLPPADNGVYAPLLPVLRQAQKFIHQGRLSEIAPLLTRFYGLGSGLTPSGDDLIMGLLLCLNRPGVEPVYRHGLDEFNKQAVRMAYEKTTSLSANLIECAAQGQADERLITGLEGITCEAGSTAESINALLAWGSSSGADALLGFALAILAADNDS